MRLRPLLDYISLSLFFKVSKIIKKSLQSSKERYLNTLDYPIKAVRRYSLILIERIYFFNIDIQA